MSVLSKQIGADEDEAHWDQRLCQIAKQQPKDAPDKPE